MKHGSHVTGLVCGLMLASLMGSFSADAAGIVWNASKGGDLALPGNWAGGVRPGTSDNARFRKNVTGEYTLSEDMTVAGVEVDAIGCVRSMVSRRILICVLQKKSTV